MYCNVLHCILLYRTGIKWFHFEIIIITIVYNIFGTAGVVYSILGFGGRKKNRRWKKEEEEKKEKEEKQEEEEKKWGVGEDDKKATIDQ